MVCPFGTANSVMRPEKLTGPIQRQANWFRSSCVSGTVAGAAAGAAGLVLSAGGAVCAASVRPRKRSAARTRTLRSKLRKRDMETSLFVGNRKSLYSTERKRAKEGKEEAKGARTRPG